MALAHKPLGEVDAAESALDAAVLELARRDPAFVPEISELCRQLEIEVGALLGRD